MSLIRQLQTDITGSDVSGFFIDYINNVSGVLTTSIGESIITASGIAVGLDNVLSGFINSNFSTKVELFNASGVLTSNIASASGAAVINAVSQSQTIINDASGVIDSKINAVSGYLNELIGEGGGGSTDYTYRGNWIIGLDYNKNDIVYYDALDDSGAYICISGHYSLESFYPNLISEYWGILSPKGADGEEGPIGPSGPSGPSGEVDYSLVSGICLNYNQALSGVLSTTIYNASGVLNDKINAVSGSLQTQISGGGKSKIIYYCNQNEGDVAGTLYMSQTPVSGVAYTKSSSGGGNGVALATFIANETQSPTLPSGMYEFHWTGKRNSGGGKYEYYVVLTERKIDTTSLTIGTSEISQGFPDDSAVVMNNINVNMMLYSDWTPTARYVS